MTDAIIAHNAVLCKIFANYFLKVLIVPQLPLDTIRLLLSDMILTRVADGAGVNYDALVRFANGDTQKPSFELVAGVAKYLELRAALTQGE